MVGGANSAAATSMNSATTGPVALAAHPLDGKLGSAASMVGVAQAVARPVSSTGAGPLDDANGCGSAMEAGHLQQPLEHRPRDLSTSTSQCKAASTSSQQTGRPLSQKAQSADELLKALGEPSEAPRKLHRRLSIQAALDQQQLDKRLERLEDRGRLVRLSYKLWNPLKAKLGFWWSEGTLQGAMEVIIALFYLVAVPYQIGFETTVKFNTLYSISYVFDGLLFAVLASKAFRASRMKSSEKRALAFVAAISPFTPSGRARNGPARACSMRLLRKHATRPAALLILSVPFEAALWVTMRSAVPFVRLTRYLHAINRAHRHLVELERSQIVPFALCRLTRVLLFFLLSTHCLACAFFFFCTHPSAAHYASAPWLASADGTASAPTASRYLRSMYWSLMTLTTAGHVDIVSSDASDSGKDWEVAAAIVVAITGTFAYIYINANFTTMMIRLNSQLEQYRAKLAGIDAYLSRNKVTKDVQKRVKRHFSSLHSADASAEKTLLDSLPYALQKEVLQDIHMRTLRRAPTLFRFESPALSAVCAIVRTVAYLPEEVITDQGDVITEMYFLEEVSE